MGSSIKEVLRGQLSLNLAQITSLMRVSVWQYDGSRPTCKISTRAIAAHLHSVRFVFWFPSMVQHLKSLPPHPGDDPKRP
jgi:hypothetical protein